MTFTAGELESIDEEGSESVIPNAIGRIFVNTSPKTQEITEIIDLKRIGPDRQTFYLAKSIDGGYNWFHVPHAEQLRKFIGDHRHQSHANADRKTRCVKKLRSGKSFII